MFTFATRTAPTQCSAITAGRSRLSRSFCRTHRVFGRGRSSRASSTAELFGRTHFAAFAASTLVAGAGSLHYVATCEVAGEDSVVDKVTAEEVAKHNKEDDCWVICDGKVYDLTVWVGSHPGGAAILKSYAGKDVSKEFNWLNHSESAKAIRSGLYIADVIDYKPPPATSTLSSGDVVKKADKPKLVIVGSGVCGSAAAHFLSESGMYDVKVLERAPLFGGTALKSSAILFLGGLVETDDNKMKEASFTDWTGHWQYDMMERVNREWEDVGFISRGTMGVIQTQEQLDWLKERLAPGGRMHGQYELLSKEQMLALEPDLSPDLLGATLVPKGATFDPYLVCRAFGNRAVTQGATIRFGVGVSSIDRRTGGGFDIKCEREDGVQEVEHADILVVCNGWKAGTLIEPLGHVLPVKGVHGQMFATHHPTVKISHNLYSWEAPHFWATHQHLRHQNTVSPEPPHERITRHLYGLQIANGTIEFGGDRVAGDLDGVVIQHGIESHMQHAREVVPALKECEVVGSWSGTMPFVPDQKPLLGPLEDGLWVVTGSPFTKGVAHAKVLSEWILGDDTNARFRDQVDPKRFAKKDK